MKFSINKSSLQSSLISLNKVIPVRSTLPILSSVLFDIQKDHIELIATDLEITLSVILPTETAETGKIAIPLKTILDITQEIPEGDLFFEITDIGKIIISTDFGKYTIMGKQPDEFPSKPSVDKPNEVIIKARDLADVIDNTNYAVSKDEMKPQLLGVLLQMKNEQITAVATDGHRLVQYTKMGMKGHTFEGEAILPSKFLSIIRGQLVNQDDVNLKISENHVQVTIDGSTIYSRIIKQRFPDYESVIPIDNDKKMTINRDEFLQSIKRVSIFSNKSTKQISLSIGDNQLIVSTEDPENITTGREKINCEYDGDPLAIGYNALYLREVLMHQKEDVVKMRLKSPVSAGIFKYEGKKEKMTTLIMPIRIND
ncbi:MAG: DNA polymerase III subunit beta [Candidatus Marinimicrobia bacterium]|jgi:DNA polymerase III subunit beta|nr:DNA polymerase III subunit beta [Candidatus Neomarinimicrobiota bacterium]MBT3683650.1 DNA polymerase III subunit beta [Candidatus Neomarinimicrobiota bacterium]MBT3760429.1 DNA polymerase III subunit beta [Candidatus Neomarinimicrobiota bacterium]MBT3896493.1 DNA polymerase III subunit beta [Candidatus Neomarinimicrobiota bacterium]MBT4173593.1 DNA polymerase III subunit beta [Candidatus Neomarinimicrobiota bacterium]